MSMNLSLAFLPGVDLADLHPDASEPVDFDEATSAAGEGVFAAALGTGVLVVDPLTSLVDVPALASAPEGTVVVHLSGVTDTYVLEVRGADPRLRVTNEGEVVQESGEALPAEDELEDADDPEDEHLELFAHLAGTDVDDLWDLSLVRIPAA